MSACVHACIDIHITHRPRPERSRLRALVHRELLVVADDLSRRCHTTNAMGTAASSGGHQRCKQRLVLHGTCVCVICAPTRHSVANHHSHGFFCFSIRWPRRSTFDAFKEMDESRWHRWGAPSRAGPSHSRAQGVRTATWASCSSFLCKLNQDCALFVPLHLNCMLLCLATPKTWVPTQPFVSISARFSVAPRRAVTRRAL